MQKNPFISVIMSVYNTPEEYLRKSIESILNQTFQNFEFLIVNDASTLVIVDNILKEYQDRRITIFTNEKNLGLTKNLNILLGISKGKYIARMDADDIASPIRFEKQYNFMEKNKNVNILGSFVKADCGVHMFSGNINRELRKVKLLFYNAGLCHPSVMLRQCFLEDRGICYDEDMKKAQDYALWVKCIQYTNLVNYPKELMYYREHDEQISRKGRLDSGGQREYSRRIRRNILAELSVNMSDEELELFYRIGEQDYDVNIDTFMKVRNILLDKNTENHKYRKKYLYYELNLYYIKIILTTKKFGYIFTNKIFFQLISPYFILNMIYRFLQQCKWFGKLTVIGARNE